jgi:hypothetical protein
MLGLPWREPTRHVLCQRLVTSLAKPSFFRSASLSLSSSPFSLPCGTLAASTTTAAMRSPLPSPHFTVSLPRRPLCRTASSGRHVSTHSCSCSSAHPFLAQNTSLWHASSCCPSPSSTASCTALALGTRAQRTFSKRTRGKKVAKVDAALVEPSAQLAVVLMQLNEGEIPSQLTKTELRVRFLSAVDQLTGRLALLQERLSAGDHVGHFVSVWVRVRVRVWVCFSLTVCCGMVG